jgi:hypothetical protein
MGGNALRLKGLSPKRIQNSEMEKLIKHISTTLVKEKIFKWILPAKSYDQKIDHGDLDLIGELSSKGNKTSPWHLEAQKALDSKAIYWNKPVASLEFEGYQIDLTGRTSKEKALTHLDFSHYSPLGNILGRLIRKTGAKWGINGLEYQIKEKDSPESQVIKTLTLSNDINQILKFCGLNPKIWHEGFKTQEEIFEYACQSHLFNKEIFKIENLNHTHRKRDRTRQDYHHWLLHITSPKIQNKTLWKIKESLPEYGERTKNFQALINQEFPKLKLLDQIHSTRKENEFIKSQKEEKFNGKLISAWTGQTGRELGDFIKGFKKSQGLDSPEELIHWIKPKDAKTIKMLVLDYQKSMEDKNKSPSLG